VQLAALAFLTSLVAMVPVIILARRILDALRRLVGADRMLPSGAVSGIGTVLLYVPATASTATVFLSPPYGFAAAAGAAIAASSAIGLLALRLVLGALREGRKEFRVQGGAACRRRFRRGRGAPLRVVRTATSVSYSCTGPASGYCVYRLELALADGGAATNLYVDEAARDHDLAALAILTSYRVAPSAVPAPL
jgi:hypothetical protein